MTNRHITLKAYSIKYKHTYRRAGEYGWYGKIYIEDTTFFSDSGICGEFRNSYAINDISEATKYLLNLIESYGIELAEGFDIYLSEEKEETDLNEDSKKIVFEGERNRLIKCGIIQE